MAKRSKKSGKKPKPEILMFLVEGPSDELALEFPIGAFMENYAPDLTVMFTRLSRGRHGEDAAGGDSTSDFGIRPDNFDRAISDRVMKDMTRLEGVYPKYIVKVIQIIDMDGAFVNDSRVVPKYSDEGVKAGKTYYGDEDIEVEDVEKFRKGHEHKRRNIDYLCGKTTIKLNSKTVPYSIYFNSCNLEHFICGERNVEHTLKCQKAREFSYRCQDDDKYFENLLSSHGLQDMSYQETWEHIREMSGVNSLSRCSNLNVMLEELREWAVNRYSDAE